jgi:hypothetical protein
MFVTRLFFGKPQILFSTSPTLNIIFNNLMNAELTKWMSTPDVERWSILRKKTLQKIIDLGTKRCWKKLCKLNKLLLDCIIKAWRLGEKKSVLREMLKYSYFVVPPQNVQEKTSFVIRCKWALPRDETNRYRLHY